MLPGHPKLSSSHLLLRSKRMSEGGKGRGRGYLDGLDVVIGLHLIMLEFCLAPPFFLFRHVLCVCVCVFLSYLFSFLRHISLKTVLI
ncbi:hypothetical protein BDQ94DRAFT_29769 [Aspergillus welwitschiae]|uniref:Uncharacterized protein n=1 Tax=Aspergillus welwitschiae TaxID=1341132 RepID=A0A3F3Q2R6_9EURO|nr:hypothetical protein BDQ94DRAFT_29769 [Aspergillus welwitschiae]RDH33458.1 hypothetical protein BDQ94DRAFT_29769 [Aspergillus welwitschiae]